MTLRQFIEGLCVLHLLATRVAAVIELLTWIIFKFFHLVFVAAE